MTAGKQINIGFSTYLRSFEFIFQHGLWIYFLYPVVLSVLLFFVGFELVGLMADHVIGYIKTASGLNNPDSWLMSVLGILISWVATLLFWTLSWFVNSWLSKYIVLILMSPVLAYISEKTEKILTGKDYPLDFVQLMRDMLRGILMALRNMFIEFGAIIFFFFIGWIPLVGWLVSLVALSLISWYFYGFSMLDYCCERRKMSVSQSVKYTREHKWLAISNGCLYSLLFLIPYIGVVIAPITGAVAASIAVFEADKQKGIVKK